jgi:hypothetical protein
MNIKRPLVPGFLKTLDQKLLLNNPLIYSTRVHLVLYYGILFILFLTGLSFLAPIDARDLTSTDIWVGFVAIICVIAFTVWLIYLLRFNVFKKYGNIRPIHGLVTFLLYFICTGTIVGFGFVYPVVESIRANNAYGDEEVVQDINSMNVKLCQLEYNLLSTSWNYDTVALVKSDTQVVNEHAYYEDDSIAVPNDGHSRYFYRMDSSRFNNRLAKTDSLVKLNDSLYLIYETPDLEFISTWWADDATQKKFLSSFQIYNKALRHSLSVAEREAISIELRQLLNKYISEKTRESIEANVNENIPPGTVAHEVVIRKYKLRLINDNLWNIDRKKTRFSGDNLSSAIRLFCYLTLGITLLIFIFRHTTVRTFFLTLLSGILLLICTALIISFSNGGELTFFGFLIGYMLVFFFGTLFTFPATRRNVVNGIMINLFVFMMPVFPTIVYGLACTLLRQSYYTVHGSYDGFDLLQYFVYAETGGAILFLVLLATYIGKIYRRWYSLPEH